MGDRHEKGILTFKEGKAQAFTGAYFYGEGSPFHRPRAIIHEWGIQIPRGWALHVEHGDSSTLIRIERNRDEIESEAEEARAVQEAKAAEDEAIRRSFQG